MNLSGDAVARITSFYKIPCSELLVVHDELDLPPGTVRLKFDGGHGGHNGLRDIFTKLGSRQFYRLRIGIGHPGRADQVTDYVLRPAPAADASLIADSIQAARRQLANIVAGDMERAMLALHSKNEPGPAISPA